MRDEMEVWNSGTAPCASHDVPRGRDWIDFLAPSCGALAPLLMASTTLVDNPLYLDPRFRSARGREHDMTGKSPEKR